MFDDSSLPFGLPTNALILRPYSKYFIKRLGIQRSRICFTGSNQAAPQFHAIASTWSFCFELWIQWFFVSISTEEWRIVPFNFLGIAQGYNEVDIPQASNSLEILCKTYTAQLLKFHDWNTTLPSASIRNWNQHWHLMKLILLPRMFSTPCLNHQPCIQSCPSSRSFWLTLLLTLPLLFHLLSVP